MDTRRCGALALALLLPVCAAQATTVCYADQKHRYGPNRLHEIAEKYSNSRKDAARASIEKNAGATNVCWVSRRTAIDDLYCRLAFSENSGLQYGEYYGNLTVGLMLDPPVSKELINYSGAPNVIGKIYNSRPIQEIWVIDEQHYPGKRFMNKVSGTLGYEQLFGYCWKRPIRIAYLNGVTTTIKGAEVALAALRNEFGDEFGGTKLQYQRLYNQTSCRDDTKTSCLGDFAETFQQRQDLLVEALRNRWEIFWDLMSGRHRQPQSTTENLFSSFGSLLGDLQAAVFNGVLQLSTSLANRSTTEDDLRNHLEVLGRSPRISTVIVAHSQGNLFADAINKHYPNSARDHESDEYPSLSFIHVAPPTTTLFGRYVLADIDKVIAGLSFFTPSSTPGANVVMPGSLRDELGHSFLETYWDSSRAAFGQVRSAISAELSNK